MQERQLGAATVAQFLKVISSSTAAVEWSWDHHRTFSVVDLPVICFIVCIASDSYITAMNETRTLFCCRNGQKIFYSVKFHGNYYYCGSNLFDCVGFYRRLSAYHCGPSSPPVNPVEQISAQPGTSCGYFTEISE